MQHTSDKINQRLMLHAAAKRAGGSSASAARWASGLLLAHGGLLGLRGLLRIDYFLQFWAALPKVAVEREAFIGWLRACVRVRVCACVRLFGWWLTICIVGCGAFCAEHDHRAELHKVFP